MSIDDEDLKPSKQQQKRDAEAAQALGARLVELALPQLQELFARHDLPTKLYEAVVACRAIKAREGKRRQLQYIGKLMRGIDPAPVQDFLAQLQRGRQAASAQHHQLERWRERLLSEGETALSELVTDYPRANAKQVRQFIEQAQRESARQQPPRASRQLFRYLRDLLWE